MAQLLAKIDSKPTQASESNVMAMETPRRVIFANDDNTTLASRRTPSSMPAYGRSSRSPSRDDYNEPARRHSGDRLQGHRSSSPYRARDDTSATWTPSGRRQPIQRPYVPQWRPQSNGVRRSITSHFNYQRIGNCSTAVVRILGNDVFVLRPLYALIIVVVRATFPVCVDRLPCHLLTPLTINIRGTPRLIVLGQAASIVPLRTNYGRTL